jgi:hypothetical protein
MTAFNPTNEYSLIPNFRVFTGKNLGLKFDSDGKGYFMGAGIIAVPEMITQLLKKWIKDDALEILTCCRPRCSGRSNEFFLFRTLAHLQPTILFHPMRWLVQLRHSKIEEATSSKM